MAHHVHKWTFNSWISKHECILQPLEASPKGLEPPAPEQHRKCCLACPVHSLFCLLQLAGCCNGGCKINSQTMPSISALTVADLCSFFVRPGYTMVVQCRIALLKEEH